MEHALKLNVSPARTGFRRRASHAGSGEKYIKFVKCCPASACCVLSTRLPRALRRPQPSYETAAVSLYPSLITITFKCWRKPLIHTSAERSSDAGRPKADIPR
jgi:hypothetical protein